VYFLIETEQQLSEGLQLLHQQDRVAFDLEFDRDRHTYGFDLCLIQIGYQNKCLIIDPQIIPDLRPVFDFFASPKVQKLVHCPGEDLRLLHSLGCYPANIADTEVMAKLLNYEQTSLAKLLEVNCGVQLNKKQQQSNWHKRPLSPEQLQYAADDVLYLFRLYDKLKEEIEDKGLTKYIQEEDHWLQEVRYTLVPKTNFLKPGELRNISPWDSFVLNSLFQLRDTIARVKNKPAFMIMPEESVRRIASENLDYTRPSEIPGLHPSLRHGNTAQELKSGIDTIFEEATKRQLDKNPQRVIFSGLEKEAYYQRKHLQHKLKVKILAPIQKALGEKYGIHAARYMLSNAWVTKWLAGECKWKDLQPSYKRKIVKETAKELGLPYDEILEFDRMSKEWVIG
jgi:ribonuclease D